MSTFKCKMCGGTLEIQSGSTVAECEYCGAKQTLPKLDDEKRANLYDRANHFRRSNEFDKASAIYEQILAEDNTDAEAYWSLVLCRYGIEYVEDPLSHRRVPTVHRAQFTSIFDDDNYKFALKNSDTYQRVIYEEEAKAINEIQKGILAISQKEEPFDVFICYKETDDSGKRTHDSVLAQDLYYQLKQEGFKVFFARITLEDKLGSAYEPYIFAALNSAKVMVVLGTKPEFFNAVWVKNEWSRFLSLIKHGEKKMLIPAYKDMDPYNLPKEFSHLQAQDMSKLGFMQDLIRGIKKILGRDKKTAIPTVERVVVQGDGHAQDAAPLLRRAFLFCEDGEFDNADEYAEKVLDINPECAEAYVVKLLIELGLKKPLDLAECKAPISDSPNYQKAVRFATPEYRETIEGYNNAIIKRIDTARKDEVYARGVELMKLHRYDEAVQYFQKIPTYKDSTQKVDDCRKLAEIERLDGIYQRATQLLNAGQFDEAARLFESIEDYKDSKEKIKLCGERKENARKDAIYSQAMNRVRSQNVNDVAIKKSIEELQTISGYRDVDDQIRALNARLEKWYEDKKKAEEAARIRAEEERRTREREAEIARIAAEKRKKKLIKTAKIGIPSVIALIVVLILLFTWIIPLIRYNQADDLLEKGEIEEADKIYRDLNGFSDSEQRIALINGTQKIQKGLFDAGITEILSAGIPVKINYGMNGGDFSGVAHISMPQREEDISVKLLSASGEAGELPNENPDTVEASFTTVKDFNGVQTPERNGYYFSHWKFEKYNYELDGIFELSLSSVWSQRKYSIEYDLVGGKISGEKNLNAYYPESDAFTLVNPTRIGYTFAGWTGADLTEPTVEVTIPTGSYGNREYVATWKPNEYTINYDANGGTISSSTQTVAYDSDVEYLIPERTGYTFLGWYDGDVKVENEKWIRTSDISLVAKWEIVGYTIGYEMNGGTNHSDNLSNYQVDTDTISLKYPSRIGYNFIGWTYEGQTTPIKDVTIEKGSIGNKTFTANWEAITTTVKFNAAGGECETTSLSATYDQNITLPTVTRKGYTFLGWYNGNTKYQSGIWKTYTDIELTAKWQIISYSISYSLGDGTNASANPRTYTVEQTITLKEPTRTGYEFLGWTYEGQTTPIKTVTIPKGTIGNKSYTANWKAITSTITFDANGGSCNKSTMSVTYNSSFTLPTPMWDGHTFSGWYNGNTKVTSGTCKLYSNTTLVAHWDIVEYSITYTLNGGTNNSANPKTYTVEQTITLQEPTRTGYTFTGWTFEGQATPTKNVTIALGTTGDKSYTANWQANTYTVTFDANGGSVMPTSDDVIFDTNVTLPTPTRTGYTFGGWFVGTKQYTTGTWKTDTNVTLVAKWIGNTYKVTYSDVGTDVKVTYNFNYTGTDNYVVTLKEGEVLSYPTMPIRSGYIFTGWYLDIACTEKFDFDVNISRDITLYAGWIKMNSDAVYSEIQLDPSKYNSSSNAYSISTSSTASTAKKYIYLVAQESGTHYIYWKNSSSSSYYGYYLQIKNLTTDTVIRNSSNTYSTSYNSVNFSCNKGDVIVISFYRYNTSYSSTAYFYFNKFNSPISSAKVQFPDGYVNYNLGENIEYSYTFGENYNLPNVTREGYTFDGWYYNGNKVESGEWKITDNATLTAKWIKNQYIITLDANGGTGVESSQIVYYDSDFILPTPTRTGYAFGGWFCGDVEYSSGTWLTPENTTLVAKWSPRTDIEYVVNHHQQNANDDDYTIVDTEKLKGTADATIKPSVKTYTHFISPSVKTVTIAPNGSLVVDYYYKRVTYDLTYVTNGGETIEKQTYKYDQTLVISTPTRVGYTFGGWFTNKTLTTAYSATATLNANTTIYAYWTEENKPNDFTYSGTSAITVSAYNGTSTTMWIPAYIGGVPVTKIPASAFANQTTLTKVVIPETVTEIGEGALKGCSALEDLTIPFVGASVSTDQTNAAVFGYIFGRYTSSASSKPTGTVYQGWSYKNDSYLITGTSSYNYAYSTNYRADYYYIPTTIKKVTVTVDTTIPYGAFQNCDFIESITISANTTSISAFAFKNCKGITEMNLGTALISIGQYAFHSCISLEKVTIPNTVSSMGSYVFSGCISLKRMNSTTDGVITLPTSLTVIPSNAFNGCTEIVKVVVGDITEIQSYAFSGCESITQFNSNNNDELIVPNGVTRIGDYAFQNLSPITKVVVPDTVTEIGEGAFKGCSALEDITLPFVGKTATSNESNDAVFGYIFGRYTSSASSKPTGTVYQGWSYKNDSYLITGTSSYNYAYSTNYRADYYYIPTTIKKVTVTSDTTIPYGAFQNCDFIESITISANTTSIFAFAFKNCKGITEMNLGTALTSIGQYAFHSCISLEKVTIPNTVSSMGSYVFSGCISLKRMNSTTDGVITLPTSLTVISSYAFNGCTEIVKVVVGDITEIQSYAFSGCESITQFNSNNNDELIVPNGVTRIGDYAFQNLSSITKVVVPDTVTEIGEGAFKGCAALEDITLPFIGKTATSNESNDAVFGYIFGRYNGDWSSSTPPSGTIYQGWSKYSDSYLITGTGGSNYSDYSYYRADYYYIPTSIKNVTVTSDTTIPYGAFQNCDFIESIIIPTTLTSIADFAFKNCKGLTEMNLGTSLTAIGRYAFDGCISLEKVTMPNSVASMGSYVFNGCIALKRMNSTTDGVITLPTSLTVIPSCGFMGCTEITKVVVGDITEIQSYVFSGCEGITQFNSNNDDELIVPNGVTKIGEYAFRNLSSITKVVVPDTVTEIGEGAFKGCAALEDITLPFIGKTATSAGERDAVFGHIFGKYSGELSYSTARPAGTIYQGWNLYSSSYPTDGTKGGNYNYSTSYKADYYYIPTSIKSVTITVDTTIPYGAFHNCDFIETIVIPTTISSTGTQAYKNCSATVSQTYVTKTDMSWDGKTVATTFAGGSGTQADPYLISSGAELALLSQRVKDGETFSGVYFRLVKNISLNGKAFTPIGSKTDKFSGVFDGNGFVISNFTITVADSYLGLFGYVTGTIENLGVQGTINVSGTTSNAYAGLFAGYSTGTIQNCFVTGTVTLSSTNTTHAGGFVGYSEGTIINCYSIATVTSTSSGYMAYAGGLVGYVKDGSVSGSYATGNVKAQGANSDYSRNGGLIGYRNSSATVTNCYRSEIQKLTRYTTVGSAYCEDGTSASLEAIKTYVSANWSNDIWSFNNSHPRFTEN